MSKYTNMQKTCLLIITLCIACIMSCSVPTQSKPNHTIQSGNGANLQNAGQANNMQNNQNPANLGEYFRNTFATEFFQHFNINSTQSSAYMAQKNIDFAQEIQLPHAKITSGKITAYEDNENGTGSLTIRINGSSGNQTFSDKEITLNNFKNPYLSYISATNSFELNLDEAIKKNMILADFIAFGNENIETVCNNIDFYLKSTNAKVSVKDKNNPHYKLELTLKADNSTSLSVEVKKYAVVLHKSTDGLTDIETSIDKTSISTLQPIQKPYFTEKDVFEYIAKQEEKRIIKTTGFEEIFASEYYAGGKEGKMIPPIFNTLDTYQAIYTKNNDLKKYLDIPHIMVGISNIQSGGITADDINGRLHFSWYITTQDNWDQTEENSTTGSTPKDATIEGFKKVNSDYFLANFMSVIFKGDKYAQKIGTEEKWKQYRTTFIVLQPNEDAYRVDDTIRKKDRIFYLEFLHLDDFSNFLAMGHKHFLSSNFQKTNLLLIRGITLRKKAGHSNMICEFMVLGERGSDEIITFEIPLRG